MKTMTNEVFEKVFNLCRSYDPATCMIDSYKQQVSAEKANDRVMKKLSETLAEYDIEISILPPYGTDWSNKTEEARENLKKYLASHDVEVEQSTKKIWTTNEIKEILNKYDDQVGKALVKLYDRQTAEEKADHETKENNGIGFNGADAPILTSFAEFYKKAGFLTAKQLVVARKKIMKYAGQLTKIANKEV